MTKNKIIKNIIIVLILVSSLISVSFASNECNSDSDCNELGNLYEGSCELSGYYKVCKYTTFLTNGVCNDDNDCNVPGVGANAYINERCDFGMFGLERPGSCEYDVTGLYSEGDVLDDSACEYEDLTTYGYTIESSRYNIKGLLVKSGDVNMCEFYKFDSCTGHANCEDNNANTLDMCNLNEDIREYTCENILDGCLKDDDCDDGLIETADFCDLSKNSCFVATFDDLTKGPSEKFDTFLKYTNNIKVIGHLNNGKN